MFLMTVAFEEFLKSETVWVFLTQARHTEFKMFENVTQILGGPLGGCEFILSQASGGDRSPCQVDLANRTPGSPPSKTEAKRLPRGSSGSSSNPSGAVEGHNVSLSLTSPTRTDPRPVE